MPGNTTRLANVHLSGGLPISDMAGLEVMSVGYGRGRWSYAISGFFTFLFTFCTKFMK
jgi:hypothetical protein